MSISRTFLGLLERGPSHGYDHKREYDARFVIGRPVAYGQVYATLSRLLKHGLVTVAGVEPGGGSERKRYAITSDGVADMETWLAEPEKPDLYLHSTLYAKVERALRSGRSATDFLGTQRAEHLRLMRELTPPRRRRCCAASSWSSALAPPPRCRPRRSRCLRARSSR